MKESRQLRRCIPASLAWGLGSCSTRGRIPCPHWPALSFGQSEACGVGAPFNSSFSGSQSVGVPFYMLVGVLDFCTLSFHLCRIFFFKV